MQWGPNAQGGMQPLQSCQSTARGELLQYYIFSGFSLVFASYYLCECLLASLSGLTNDHCCSSKQSQFSQWMVSSFLSVCCFYLSYSRAREWDPNLIHRSLQVKDFSAPHGLYAMVAVLRFLLLGEKVNSWNQKHKILIQYPTLSYFLEPLVV